MTADTPLVEMIGIRQTFGHVVALDGVDLSVGSGEIVALLGDNGAGKSTLVKMLAGVSRPDSGTIRMRGTPVRFRDSRDAIAAGIETIFQGAALVEQLSVARNLFLGREPSRRFLGVVPRLDHAAMNEVSRTLLARMGLHRDIDPAAPVADLSGGERQSIAIARAMHFKADLIILDEPTNNLGVEETRWVLRFIQDAKAAGRSSLFITHNLFHVFQVVDRVVVLRRGRKVADLPVGETDIEEVERLITGMSQGKQSSVPAG